ncbi:MAG: hypothetical protein ACK5O7_02735 [Holosporales bacterium]
MKRFLLLLTLAACGCSGPSAYPKLNDVPIRPAKPDLEAYAAETEELQAARTKARHQHQQIREDLGMPAELECQTNDKSRVRRSAKERKGSKENHSPALGQESPEK